MMIEQLYADNVHRQYYTLHATVHKQLVTAILHGSSERSVLIQRNSDKMCLLPADWYMHIQNQDSRFENIQELFNSYLLHAGEQQEWTTFMLRALVAPRELILEEQHGDAKSASTVGSARCSSSTAAMLELHFVTWQQLVSKKMEPMGRMKLARKAT